MLDLGRFPYKDATNKVVYVDNTPYVLGASTILKTAKGSIIAVGDSAILTALAENDEVTGIDIKDGVVTSLVATKIASVQTTAVTNLIATLDSNELNPAHADFNKDGNNVSNARSAYDALTPAQRDFVTNYDKLVAAEAALAAAAKEADEAAVAAAKEAVTLGDTSAVIADLTLPTAPAGVTFTWESSNTTVLGNDGKVTRPAYVDGDATVTLTVTITKGDVSDTKEFTVVVKAESVVKAVNDAADATAMRAALQDLVDNGDFDAASTEKWNSLVGSQKDTVAGDVLTAKGAGFEDLAALQAAFTTALGL